MTGNPERHWRGGSGGRWRGQRGFTLIELVAVMGILAILVAIVAPAAANTERTSITAQARSDAPLVRTAANDFFTRQNESEVTIPHSVDLTTTVNGVDATSTQQRVSSRWPEIYITEAATGVPSLTGLSPARTLNSQYNAIFEAATTTPKVVNVKLLKEDGTTPIPVSDLLTKFTAIDLQLLVNEEMLQKLPDGVGKTSATGVDTLMAPNFLWLFKKQSSTVGTDDDRAIAVFTLVKVQQIEPGSGGAATTVELTYQQIFGN